jgi:Ca2+-binding RTX toxin-like protein
MVAALVVASGVALAGTFYGTLGDDKIKGSEGSDYMNGQNGNDYLEGRGGADTVYGSLDKDTIYGDYGPEFGTPADPADRMYGNDKLYGDNGDDWLYGGDGNDRLDGSTNNDTLRGEKGNDTLYGSTGNDYLYGGSGCDILYGSLGGDTIFANNKESCENSETTADGKKIDDKVYGEDGTDRIITVGDSSNGTVDIIYCGFGDGDTVWKDPEDVVPVPGNCEVKGTLPLPDGEDK